MSFSVAVASLLNDTVLEEIRDSNDLRHSRAKEVIGVLYAICALAMVVYALLVALLQTYMVPLSFLPYGARVEIAALYHYSLLLIAFVISTLLGGATGFLVVFTVYFLWAIVIVALASVQYCRHSSVATNSNEKTNEEEMSPLGDEPPSDVQVAEEVQRPDSHAVVEGPREGSPPRPNPLVVGASDRPEMSREEDATNDGQPQPTQQGVAVSETVPFSWVTFPSVMSGSQVRSVVVAFAGFLTIVLVIVTLIFAIRIDDYRIVNPNGSAALVENQPSMTATSIAMMYTFPRMAINAKLQIYIEAITEYCGKRFTKTYSDDDDKKKNIYDAWILKYNINMSWYEREDYRQYSSVNDWFTREIKAALPPVAAGPVSGHRFSGGLANVGV